MEKTDLQKELDSVITEHNKTKQAYRRTFRFIESKRQRDPGQCR